MSFLKNKLAHTLNRKFSKNVSDCKDQIVDDFVVGEFLTLYSLKTIVDDKPFYFAPFVACNDKDLIRQALQCSDYRYIICKLGYYSVSTGELYRDYIELNTVSKYLKKYSKNYDLVHHIFVDSVNEPFNLFQYAVDNTLVKSKNESLYNNIKDYITSNGVYFPDLKDIVSDLGVDDIDEYNEILNPSSSD